MAVEDNGFLEYLQLQGGSADLLTKSELIAAVRDAGYSFSDRKLTYYASEDLIPRSVRVGSRAGVYPAVVAELTMWILRAREGGVTIEALKELLPVWKFLMRAREGHVLDLAEFEDLARRHIQSVDGSLAVPPLIADVMMRWICPDCRGEVQIVAKDGTKQSMSSPSATVGFAMARMSVEDDNKEPTPRWFASTRLSLADARNYSSDPTTVILGLPPGATLPPDPDPQLDHETCSPDH